MKNIYILLVLIFLGGFARSQETQPPLDEKKLQDIEALKVAFISKELDLTPDEAQKFWPVYNQYSKELKEIRKSAKDDGDVLDRDEKVLNIRKRYKEQFSRILGPQRMNKMYDSEGRFHQLLIKAMRKQHNMQDKQNRPMFRKGN